MKKVFAFLAILLGASSLHAVGPFIGYVQISSGTGGPVQPGGFNTSTGTVGNLTVTGTLGTPTSLNVAGPIQTSSNGQGIFSGTLQSQAGFQETGVTSTGLSIGSGIFASTSTNGSGNNLIFDGSGRFLFQSPTNSILSLQPQSSTQTVLMGGKSSLTSVFDMEASSTSGTLGIDIAGGNGGGVIDFWKEPTQVTLTGQIIGNTTTTINGTPANVGDLVLIAGNTLPNQPNNLRLWAGNVDVMDISSGSIVTGKNIIGNGSQLTNLTAANVSAGTLGGSVIASSIAVNTIGIGQHTATGTPSSSTFLRGDNSWATVASGVTIGNAVSGGIANTVLFEDASQNVASTGTVTISTSTGILSLTSSPAISGLVSGAGRMVGIGSTGNLVSLLGTAVANQTTVAISTSGNTATFGTVQNIGTGSSPQFQTIGLGTPATATSGNLVVINAAANAGVVYGNNTTAQATTLGSNNVVGMYGTAYTNVSGTQSGDLAGAEYFTQDIVGTITGPMYGILAKPYIAGTVTNLYGLDVVPEFVSGGALTNYYGIRLNPSDQGGSGFNPTNYYGIYIDTVPSGGYSIYSSSGQVFMGGKLTVNGGNAGRTDNMLEPAGNIGEVISSATISTMQSIAGTGTFGNVVSVTVTTGDWDASGCVSVSSNSSTATGFEVSISTFTGNTTTDHVEADNLVKDAALPNTTDNQTICVPMYPMILSGNTTVYLKVKGTYTVGQPQAIGKLKCRRRA